jgi:hypothetical protein
MSRYRTWPPRSEAVPCAGRTREARRGRVGCSAGGGEADRSRRGRHDDRAGGSRVALGRRRGERGLVTRRALPAGSALGARPAARSGSRPRPRSRRRRPGTAQRPGLRDTNDHDDDLTAAANHDDSATDHDDGPVGVHAAGHDDHHDNGTTRDAGATAGRTNRDDHAAARPAPPAPSPAAARAHDPGAAGRVRSLVPGRGDTHGGRHLLRTGSRGRQCRARAAPAAVGRAARGGAERHAEGELSPAPTRVTFPAAGRPWGRRSTRCRTPSYSSASGSWAR